jgi:hypothetical protein
LASDGKEERDVYDSGKLIRSVGPLSPLTISKFLQKASRDRFEVPVTLIPLRHGLLPYPSVIIQPAPPTTAVTTHEQRPEQQAPLSFENHQIDAASQVKVHPAPVQQVLVRVVREVKDEVLAEGVVA